MIYGSVVVILFVGLGSIMYMRTVVEMKEERRKAEAEKEAEREGKDRGSRNVCKKEVVKTIPAERYRRLPSLLYAAVAPGSNSRLLPSLLPGNVTSSWYV